MSEVLTRNLKPILQLSVVAWLLLFGLLLSGDVHFTTAAAASVLKRRSDPGVPIVAFALFGQQGEQAYMALANNNPFVCRHFP